MTFIETTPPADARDDTLAMYERFQAVYGYIPNYAKAFSLRPGVMEEWRRLLAAIRRPMKDRRFELVTLAAAHALCNSACALAHGTALSGFMSADGVRSLLSSSPHPSVSDEDRAIVDFVRRIIANASSVTRADIDGLRTHGLSDADIFDVAAAAAARSFFAKLLDALGVQADAIPDDLDPGFKAHLMVGRPQDTLAVESLPRQANSPVTGVDAVSASR